MRVNHYDSTTATPTSVPGVMASTCVVSELLCYLQNYVDKIPHSVLSLNLSGFYKEEEIVDAKTVLFSVVGDMKLQCDDMPRNKQRRGGENKRKLDVEDILAMWEFLDTKKIMLPDFVAKDLRRLPNIHPSDVDTYKLADTVNEVKLQLSNVQAVLKTLADNQASMATTVDSIVNVNIPVVHKTAGNSDNIHNNASPTFSDMFANKDDGSEWFPVKSVKKQESRPIRKIVGGNSSSDLKVKAIAGSREWHVFAGRLDPSTTEEDIAEMLSTKKIKVVNCKLLRKTADWQHKYAAFRVVVNIEDKDNVFDDSVWPVGTDVRDWYFKSNQ